PLIAPYRGGGRDRGAVAGARRIAARADHRRAASARRPARAVACIPGRRRGRSRERHGRAPLLGRGARRTAADRLGARREGPGGLTGIAPGASVLPLRVAGWQRDAIGDYAIYARTDQILAGLERAVDPNGDGDAHDAARIALVSLAQPFAAFTDDPLAQAAA